MFKIDKIKVSFDCDLCKKLLVDPIVLPCGNCICSNLNLLEPSPLYEECKKEIEYAKEKEVKIEQLKKDPESYLY